MYRGSSDATRRAVAKFHKEKIDTIAYRVPKGEKDRLKDIASQVGLSLNAFIDSAVKEKIDRLDRSRQVNLDELLG